MPKLRPLLAHADFERMRIFTRAISVWKQGELVDSGMIIQSHDENTVISTKNEHYQKSDHQFFYGTHL